MTKGEKIFLIEKMNARLLALKNSPLYKYRRDNNYLPVLGEGSLSAKVMFIGEAPGHNEAKTGRPFCGAAGKVLDELLKSIQLDRKGVYITNIVKDRPPENRDPSTEEIKVYGPMLDEQIRLINPKIIVTLGRYSMRYIFEKFDLHSRLGTISEVHGKSFNLKNGRRSLHIVALYHPCVAIYQRSKLSELKKDIKIIKNLLK